MALPAAAPRTWPLLLVWFTARGRGWSFVRAKWDAVRGMSEAWRARTYVQALRVRCTPEEIGFLPLDRIRRGEKV